MENNAVNFKLLMKQMRFIFAHAKKYWLILLMLPFLIVVDIYFEIGIAYMQGYFIDTVSTGDQGALFYITKWISAVLIGAILLLIIHRFMIDLLLGLVQRDLSHRLFNTVNAMPYEQMSKMHSGDVVTRIKDDTQKGTNIIDASIEFITVVFIIGLSFMYLLRIDVVLAVLAIIGAPMLLMVGRLFDKGISSLSRQVQTKESEIRAITQEFVQGIPTVKIYNIGGLFNRLFMKKRTELNIVQRKLDMKNSLSDNLSELIYDVMHVSALLFIGLAAIRGQLTPGTIVTFSLLFELVIWPVLGLSSQWNRLYEGAGAFQRVIELFNFKKDQTSQRGERDLGASTSNTALHCEQLVYQIDDEQAPLIAGIDFELKRGETVGIVGASGAGKSTFLNLCSKLYEPTQGTVSVEGELIYLSQFPFLFSGSVKENIKLDYPDVTDGMIVDAARKAQAHEFIKQLDQTYDHTVKEGGSNFSGGQKQRLALSRLFVSDASIILLDEPTSALDTMTENKVIAELKPLFNNKTVLFSSHRLSIISQLCDRILVFDAGKIVEQGSHENLMKSDGIYKRMIEAQLVSVE